MPCCLQACIAVIQQDDCLNAVQVKRPRTGKLRITPNCEKDWRFYPPSAAEAVCPDKLRFQARQCKAALIPDKHLDVPSRCSNSSNSTACPALSADATGARFEHYSMHCTVDAWLFMRTCSVYV
jgi:hypothetical protein